MYVYVLLILVFFISLFYTIRFYHRCWKYVMEIPGPEGRPIIGTMLPSYNPEVVFNDDRTRALQYYPIYKLWSFNTYFISLISPEDIELLLTNSTHNNKSFLYSFLHEWLGTGLLTSNGDKWRARRKLLTPAFHFNILQPFIDVFNRETKHLVDDLEKSCHKDYIDVVKPITDFTLFSIGETSLGVNLRENNQRFTYKNAIHQYGHTLAQRILKPILYFDFLYKQTKDGKHLKNNAKILHDFSKKIIEERRTQADIKNVTGISYSEKKRLALLDLMLEAGMDNEAIREEVDTFMFEGHDTTALALCYILVTLANEEKYQNELYEEIISILGDSTNQPTYQAMGDMKIMERCIKECLRLYPSVPFISRVTGETIKTHSGYIIPKGSVTNVYIYDLHHSPEVWDNPEVFNPDRFLPDNVAQRHPFAYLPFSAGGRNCIGQKFAMLELKAALSGILRKFKLQPIDTRADLKFKIDLILRPVGEIKVKFVYRV